jgi:hypothetical protein
MEYRDRPGRRAVRAEGGKFRFFRRMMSSSGVQRLAKVWLREGGRGGKVSRFFRGREGAGRGRKRRWVKNFFRGRWNVG